MRHFAVAAGLAVVLLVAQAEAVTSFYTMDASPNPNPRNLAWFDSVPPASTVTLIGSVHGFEQSDRTTFMDLSANSRLFASPMLTTLYELDPDTGAVLDSMVIGNKEIEGITARFEAVGWAVLGGRRERADMGRSSYRRLTGLRH